MDGHSGSPPGRDSCASRPLPGKKTILALRRIGFDAEQPRQVAADARDVSRGRQGLRQRTVLRHQPDAYLSPSSAAFQPDSTRVPLWATTASKWNVRPSTATGLDPVMAQGHPSALRKVEFRIAAEDAKLIERDAP